MILESYKLGMMDQQELVHLLKLLAFQYSDCEIHPFQIEDGILIIVSSKQELKDNFITSLKEAGVQYELLMAS